MVSLRFGDQVADVTTYLSEHPGGPDVLEALNGKDAVEAFREVGHSKAALRRLEGLLQQNSTHEPVATPASVSQKLFTMEDPYNLHKALGAIVAFHFFVLRPWGILISPLPAILTPLAAVGCALLSLSSLRFRVPRSSNRVVPTIHAMFRAHSIIFALRSVACSFANFFLSPRQAMAARCVVVFVTLAAADKIDRQLRDPGDDYRTTASMPYWPNCSDARRRAHQFLYAYAQTGATIMCVMKESALRVLDPCIAIQGAAFALTLSRKGILSPYGYHIIYTCQLLYVLILGLGGQQEYATTALLLLLARRDGANKYLLWTTFVLLVSWQGLEVHRYAAIAILAFCKTGAVRGIASRRVSKRMS